MKFIIILYLILILMLKFLGGLSIKQILRVLGIIMLIAVLITVILCTAKGLIIYLIKKPLFWIVLVVIFLTLKQ